jgi:hypothetical protein
MKFHSELDAALALGAQGYPVFPCRMNKRPACSGGFYAAVTSADDIRELWRESHGDLIGVPTGLSAAFDCLDIDAKHELAHAWWNRHRDDIPPTRAHRTRSGGIHLLFRPDGLMQCSAGKLAAGVDTRGSGGYIIWWPAAGYPILDQAELNYWPDWLVAKFAPKPQPIKQTNAPLPPRGDSWLRGLARTIANAAEGQRNSTSFWAACRAREISLLMFCSRRHAISASPT